MRPGGNDAFGDFLAFRKLITGSNAVPVFWIAEGANLLFWIMQYTIYRYNGAEAFFLSLAGFVLVAILIRVVLEIAVSATRN